jgi:hypothetical protein
VLSGALPRSRGVRHGMSDSKSDACAEVRRARGSGNIFAGATERSNQAACVYSQRYRFNATFQPSMSPPPTPTKHRSLPTLREGV